MATIKNTIQTNFTSKGAAKVKDDTESVGRAQTRMGQASASAGRSFAAQSQGLGGLVGAYAGAAATVFALEAAFTALAKAAQAETIVKGTSALASGIAQSGPRIIASLQEITQGQLTLAEAAQNANIGLSAGFDSSQIEGLTKVAMGASRALGRNLTDSLQRVFRGVAKLEPELLDELGIFVRIEPAVNAYARSLGVAASSLSQFERGQAFANAAIEEGTRKFGMIDVSAPSAQKSLEQLQTQVMELALEFGQLLTQILLPFVNFLKNDAGNALVLFGGILLLVFSKSIDILRGFGAAGLTNFTNFANAGIASLGSVKAAMTQVTVAGATMNKQFAKGITGSNLTAAEIRKMGGAFGDVKDTSATSGRFQQKGVGRDAASAASAARTAFTKGTIKSNKDLKIHIAALTAVKGSLGKNTIAYAQTTTMINSMNASLAKTGPVAKLASAALSGLARVAGLLGTVMSGLMGIFSTFFIVASVFELAGVNVFGRIKDFFVDTSQAAKNMEAAVTGAFTNMAGGGGELTKELKRIGGTDTDLEKIGSRMNMLNDDLMSIALKANEAADKLTDDSGNITSQQARTKQTFDKGGLVPVLEQIREVDAAVISMASLSDVLISNVDTAEMFDAKIAETRRRLLQLAAAEGITEETMTQLTTILDNASTGAEVQNAAIQKVVGATTLLGAAEQELKNVTEQLLEGENRYNYELRERKILLEAAIKLYKQVDEALLPVIGSLSRITGITPDTLVEMFAGGESQIKQAADSVTIFGIELKKLDDGTYSFESLTKDQQLLAEASIISSNAMKQAKDSFLSGATTSDKLASVIAGVTAQIKNAGKALKGAGLESSGFFDTLKDRRDELIEFQKALKKTEATFKGLTKTFSKEIKDSENLRFSGIISADNVNSRLDSDRLTKDKFFLDSIGKVGNMAMGMSTSVSQLANSMDEARVAQMKLIGSIGRAGGEYAKASEKVAKYNKALEDGATRTELASIAPNANEVQQAEAYAKNEQIALGILIKQGITMGELNAKHAERLQLIMQQNSVALAGLAVQKQQVSIAGQQQAFQFSARKNQMIVQSLQIRSNRLQGSAQEKELRQQERIDRSLHFARVRLAKSSGADRANHRVRMQELRSELEIMNMQADLEKLKLDPTRGLNDVKKARLAIIEAEKKALTANHKLQMAAIKAQAGATARAREIEMAEIARNILVLAPGIKSASGQTRGSDQMDLVEDPLRTTRFSGGRKDPMRTLIPFNYTPLLGAPEIKRSQGPNEDPEIIQRARRSATQEERQARLDVFNREQQLLLDKIEHDLKMAESAKKLEELAQKRLTAMRTLEDTKLRNDRAAEDAQFAFVDEFLVAISGFGKFVELFANKVNQQLQGEGAKKIKEMEGNTIIADARSRIAQRKPNTEAERLAEDNALAEVRAVEDAINKEKLSQLDLQQTNLMQLAEIQKSLTNEQRANFISALEREMLEKQIQVNKLRRQYELLEAEGTGGGHSVQLQLNEAQAQYTNGMRALTIAMQQGEDQLGKFDTDMNAVRNTIEDGLITAFSDLGDILLGLGDETKSFGEQVKDVFRSFMQSIIKEIQMQAIVKPLAGAISGMLFAGGGPVHLAAGGSVRHMADGGQVNALRDRVPAMLEPGEFVIRKNSAKSIGRNRLGQMNATGSAGIGNIEFNIVNEGSPKQAEQEGPPKFDADKIVVEVVMRDLENNGPIRKALSRG